MSDDAAVISETLERVAERVGDPTPFVFQRLFADAPEIEALFIRDPAGLVRGQMFQSQSKACWISWGTDPTAPI